MKYDDVARAAGFSVVKGVCGYFWCHDGLQLIGNGNYLTEICAWWAACVENNLIGE